ncbi:MAG: hypothetical protein K8M05_33515, partial [Deltaproteobacteria bacterium]|nr:hypothetical protein [Kofleriaceae bacterium]
YRQAQLAAAERDPRATRRLARRILAIDPAHAGARGLVRSVFYASVESATELEVYPGAYAQRLAVGETVTASVFPGARWSATMIYEYRRRFATNNQRFAVRGDWRVNERLSILGLVRAGVVEVVPLLTALAEARVDQRGWVLGGRYVYDRMPWPGELHRAQAMVGAPLGRGLRVDAEGFLGVLRGCDEVRPVWGARGRLAWSGRRWELGGGGGYGLEADRGTTAALVDDPCVGTTRDLVELEVVAGGLDVQRRFGPRWSARVGYGLELRPASVRVHLASLAVRAWF